ncbi:MAG TPA: bifunctional phosphopantothenoylcysteine decarboxylase/phosphopantothenate--cysteine ligase CoaBC [Alphaproteobacteria bacterium]
MQPFEGKRILLIVAGGIAAYKSLELVRRLRERGAAVRTVLTAGGAEFVTPLSLAALSEDKVYRDLFSLTDESEMGHIRLSREADLVVVAPASADLIAKMAAGLADDLASTVLLATDTPVLIAPAMNHMMWQHPATRRNIATLARDGVRRIGPEAGDLACGEVGAGRMAEPAAILAEIERLLAADADRPLHAVRALVTSGPTHEPIDPVRYLANRSSGKQGHAIARAIGALGAEVTLVTGPTALADPACARVVRVETAQEMLAACEAALPVDVAVCAAAVGDWRPARPANRKIKRDGGGPPALDLAENPDILATLAGRKRGRPTLVIGFAAETERVVENATAKRAAKGCDWILANDVSAGTGVFGGDETTVHVIDSAGAETWAKASKDEVAERLARRIAAAIGERGITA